jgi:hypothetical protein
MKRSGIIFDSKSGKIFGFPELINVKDFNDNNNFIFKNKSKSICQIFIILPILKISFPVSFYNIPPSNEKDSENNLNPSNFIANKILEI